MHILVLKNDHSQLKLLAFESVVGQTFDAGHLSQIGQFNFSDI